MRLETGIVEQLKAEFIVPENVPENVVIREFCNENQRGPAQRQCPHRHSDGVAVDKTPADDRGPGIGGSRHRNHPF